MTPLELKARLTFDEQIDVAAALLQRGFNVRLQKSRETCMYDIRREGHRISMFPEPPPANLASVPLLLHLFQDPLQ